MLYSTNISDADVTPWTIQICAPMSISFFLSKFLVHGGYKQSIELCHAFPFYQMRTLHYGRHTYVPQCQSHFSKLYTFSGDVCKHIIELLFLSDVDVTLWMIHKCAPMSISFLIKIFSLWWLQTQYRTVSALQIYQMRTLHYGRHTNVPQCQYHSSKLSTISYDDCKHSIELCHALSLYIRW